MATNYNYFGGIVTNGLVLNLDAAKLDSYPGSGTTWRDISGNNNNGTLTNGPTFSGIGKQASIVFDGVDDYADCGNNSVLNFTTNFTIGAWVNANATQASVDSGILGKITDANSYQGYMIWFTSGKVPTLYIRGTTLGATFPLSSNTWYYVVGTYNGTTASLYINGILNSSTNLSVSADATASNFWVGKYQFSTGGRNFTGKVATAQAYNRALSADEVSQNFNALRGRYGI
jgi:hypothetical protein